MGKHNRQMAALAIGFSVYLAHSFMIPVDGCSINPTRSIGPALIATFRVDDASLLWKHMWIFWVGPLAGSALACGLHLNMRKIEEALGKIEEKLEEGTPAEVQPLAAEPATEED